jgi:hypothetical protein
MAGHFNVSQLRAVTVEPALVEMVDKDPAATADIEDAACPE